MMLSDARINEIKNRCEAATPGPWYEGFIDNDGEGPIPPELSGEIFTAAEGEHDQEICTCWMLGGDSQFIANARQDIPDLLTELSHSHKENAMLWKVLDEAKAEIERLQGKMKTTYDENHITYHVEAEGSEAKHIIELLNDEADGLLVRLPCKEGTTIYHADQNAAYTTMRKVDGDDNSCYIPGLTEALYGEFGVDWFIAKQ